MIKALTLYCVPGVGPGRFKKLVDHFGSPGAALAGDNDEFAKEADRRAEKARASLRLIRVCSGWSMLDMTG